MAIDIVDRIPAIEAKMKEIIVAGVYDSTLESVIVGRKVRSSNFVPPLIQIVGIESPIDSMTAGISEEWAVNYMSVGVVKSYEHEDADKESKKLALQASSELLKNRTNRTLDGLCRTIDRARWSPTNEQVANDETVFATGVIVEVKFTNKEVC